MMQNESTEAHKSRAATSHGAGAAVEAAHQTLPFEIRDGEGHNMHVAIFTVPRGMEAQLVRHSVNARGAQFVFKLGQEPGTITSTFYSSDAVVTAEAIGVRLAQRLNDPSPPGAEECSIM